jgi:uncharacterized protein (DUF1778 family)
MASKKPRITIRVSDDEMQKLQIEADKAYRTVPAFVLTLVKKFLNDKHDEDNT